MLKYSPTQVLHNKFKPLLNVQTGVNTDCMSSQQRDACAAMIGYDEAMEPAQRPRPAN